MFELQPDPLQLDHHHRVVYVATQLHIAELSHCTVGLTIFFYQQQIYCYSQIIVKV